MRLALLSNITVDLLAGMLKKEHEVYCPAGFDSWQQEILFSSSGLYSFKPEAVIILLYTEESFSIQIIDEWCSTVKMLTTNLPGIPIFVSSLDITTRCAYGAEQRTERELENTFVERIQSMHDGGASIYLLPVKDVITDVGRNAFYSPKMWYIGSMPYSMKGLAALDDLICHYVSAIKGMKKKCLAVDLDNTLWGGVIGEDGVEGIQLSNHKEGARYYDTQKLLKKMKNQGVMLAILSKNNREDVEPVFQHPDMLLQHEDFVAEVINWEPKCQSIRQLAKDLNIGLDAFVFLDDNPAEREQMKAECPEVVVLDFPKDTSLLPSVIAAAYDDYFLSMEVTGEDLKKTAMYRAESQRKAELSAATSVDDFLRKLEMTMEIHFMQPQEEKRVVQLVNKTNQFNVTTKRYSEQEINSLASAENSDIITVQMADKYGDQGLVAVLILKYDDSQADIDTFLMSCRVMGRSAENEILARIKQMMVQKGITKIHALYVKTAKNIPVTNLFDRLGFTQTDGNEEKKEYIAPTVSLPEPTGLFKEVKENWT